MIPAAERGHDPAVMLPFRTGRPLRLIIASTVVSIGSTDRAQDENVSKPSTRTGKRWARILFPDQFQLGIKGMADLCDWHIRAVTSGRPFVIPRERYEGVTARMVQAVKIGDATRPFDGDLIRQAVAALSYGPHFPLSELPELPEDVVNPQTREEFWGALRLHLMMSTDAELPNLLRVSFAKLLRELPEASLWYVALTPARLGGLRRSARCSRQPSHRRP